MEIEVTPAVISEMQAQMEFYRMRCLMLAKEKEDALNALAEMRKDLAARAIADANANGAGDPEGGPQL